MGNKKGIGCGGAVVVLILIGVFISIVSNIGKGAREAQESVAASSTASVKDPYEDIINEISPACRKIGISPSKISGMTKIDNWDSGEQYRFSYDGISFNACMNEDGTVNSINCGTNKMYADGEALISYMNGFLVRSDGGTVENGVCEANGIVMNLTGVDCSYVEVDVGYYDKNGVKVTSGIDNVMNLKNGEQWRFKAYGFGDGITNYIIQDITWY